MNGTNMQHKLMKKTLKPMIIRKQGDLDKRKAYLSPEVGALAANPTSDNITLLTWTQETLPQSQPQTFPTTISLWEDSPVKPLVSLESVEALLKPEELYSLK